MTEPKKPADPPEQGGKPDPSHAPNGIPPAAEGDEAKGLPNSDRANTETAAQD